MAYAPGVSGEVVWHQDLQQGYMVFENLPVNDPSAEQYQLWIVDGAPTHPVDGGVFDVTSSGEVIVPIDPKLEIKNPVAFGVTVEPPGGVVVSDRTKRVVVAPL